MTNSVWFGTLIKEQMLDIDIKSLVDFVYQRKNELPNSSYGSSVDSWQSPDLSDNPVFEPLKIEIFKYLDEMNEILNSNGGFVEAYWNGDSKTEQKIKELTKATIRCIPLNETSKGKCILSGDLNSKKVVFARAY